MLADVREALGYDEVGGDLERLRQAAVELHRQSDRYGGASDKLLERNGQAVRADDRRVDSMCDGAELLERQCDLVPRLVQANGHVPIADESRLQQAQFEREGDQ